MTLENVDYFAFGGYSFSTDGLGNISNQEYNWSLVDDATGTVLESYSQSHFDNVHSPASNSGSQPGFLLKNRSYTFYSEYSSSSNFSGAGSESPSTTSGMLFLTSSVPEPTSAILFSLGLGTCLIRRRRK